LDETTRGEVDEALDYLQEHGRAAALPDVRHRIQTSRHFPRVSEVRVNVDEDHVYRVLVGFGPHDVPALLLAGNKARLGNRWYDENVPVADGRFDTHLTALARAGTTTEEP
jgi:hypothetical protein